MNLEFGHKFSKETGGQPSKHFDKEPEKQPAADTGQPTPAELAQYEQLDKEIEQQLAALIDEENASDELNVTEHKPREGKKIISFHELWENIKDRLIDWAPSFILNNDRIIDAYARTMGRSIDLGKQASRLFNFLAKHGLRRADQGHVYIDTQPILAVRVAADTAKIATAGADLRKSQAIKETQAIINERFTEQPISRTSELLNNWREERFIQRVSQVGKRNVIEERIVNYLGKDGNYGTADLYMHDKVSGQTLELAELLPAGYTFVPAEMQVVKEEFVYDEDQTQRIERTIIPKSLDEYQGTQNASPHTFYSARIIDRIGYGELTKKGEMLSLLHEIAHAWQAKYHSNIGRVNWEEFYIGVSAQLELLTEDRKKQAEELSVADEQTKEREKWIYDWHLEYAQEKLMDMGVEIDENYLYTDQLLGEGRHKLRSIKNRQGSDIGNEQLYDFYVKSDRIKLLVEDFTLEERDAWAHAIRVLRFLRKEGFDLEPDLKTLKDFQQVIHSALETYQTGLVRDLEPTKDMRTFTIKGGHIPENEAH